MNQIKEELELIRDYFLPIMQTSGRAKEPFIKECLNQTIPHIALVFMLNPSDVTHVGKKSFEKRKPISADKYYESIFDIIDDLKSVPAVNDQMIANIHHAFMDLGDIKGFAYMFICKDITLGITAKTVNKVMGMEVIPEFKCMLANKYFEHQDKVDGKHFYLTEKLDGCFTGDTRVLMADGTEKRIDEICLGDLVMSFNEETKDVSPQRVVNVFHNGIKPIGEWTRICCDKTTNKANYIKVNATKNHKFFTSQGWVAAEDVSSCMSTYIYDYIPSKSQISFLVGSALGDGSAMFDNRLKNKRVRFCIAHKNDNANTEYMNMICGLFVNHASPIRHRVSGYGSDIIYTNIGVINALPNCFHNQNNYVHTSIDPTKNDLFNLIDPLAIAVWYIDDGSMRRGREDGANDSATNVTSRATIATNRYEKEMVERLTGILSQKFDIECFCVRDKKRKDGTYGYRIDFNKCGAQKLFELITPYIPSCMRYKIPYKYHSVKEIQWWKDTGKSGMRLTDVYQSEMKQTYRNQNGTYKKCKCFESYDIEAENNHTYFANGFAVHNCRCIAKVTSEEVHLYSRQGQPIENIPVIEEDLRFLRQKIGKDFVFDGELLVTDRDAIPSKEQYKQTTMIVRKDGIKSGVTYNVFDVLDFEAFDRRACDTPYYLRRQKLDSYCDLLPTNIAIKPLPILYHGSDTSKIIEHLNIQRSLQHEGVMINLADEPYQFTRTNALLKVKVMQDCDLEIIGVQEGQGKFAGTLGALTVDYKGTQSRCIYRARCYDTIFRTNERCQW